MRHTWPNLIKEAGRETEETRRRAARTRISRGGEPRVEISADRGTDNETSGLHDGEKDDDTYRPFEYGPGPVLTPQSEP